MSEKIKNILCDFTEIPMEEITDSSFLVGDLGLNSLDVASFITKIEDDFDIEIADSIITKIQTVEDVEKYVNQLV